MLPSFLVVLQVHFGEAGEQNASVKDKGDNEEVQAEVAEDYKDLGYPKLQVLIFVECSSDVGIDAYDIIKEVYCHVSCVYLYPSPRWLIVVFVNLFSPFPPKVKFCQSCRTRCLCDTGFATMAPITPNTTLHVNKYMKEILNYVISIIDIYTYKTTYLTFPNPPTNPLIFNNQVSIMLTWKFLLSTNTKKIKPLLNIIRKKKESIF